MWLLDTFKKSRTTSKSLAYFCTNEFSKNARNHYYSMPLQKRLNKLNRPSTSQRPNVLKWHYPKISFLSQKTLSQDSFFFWKKIRKKLPKKIENFFSPKFQSQNATSTQCTGPLRGEGSVKVQLRLKYIVLYKFFIGCFVDLFILFHDMRGGKNQNF